MTALIGTGQVLAAYVGLHNEVFRFSLRRLLPIPWLFRPIPFDKHVAAAAALRRSLDIYGEPLRNRAAPGTSGAILVGYMRALSEAIDSFRFVCEQLNRKREGGSYPRAKYDRDLAEYQSSVMRYQDWGLKLNRLMERVRQ